MYTSLERTFLAQELPSSGHEDGIYNLGTGNGLSVRAILRASTAETSRSVPAFVKPHHPTDPSIVGSDPSAAREALKFYALHSDILTIIKKACAWLERTICFAPKRSYPDGFCRRSNFSNRRRGLRFTFWGRKKPRTLGNNVAVGARLMRGACASVDLGA
jgi:hypothetical protein